LGSFVRLAGLAFVFEPVALATDLHDMRVVQEAIDVNAG